MGNKFWMDRFGGDYANGKGRYTRGWKLTRKNAGTAMGEFFSGPEMDHPSLTQLEENILGYRGHLGDQEARVALMKPHYRLVRWIAGLVVPREWMWEDAVQEGLLGLWTATARWEPYREARFATYAVWWVRQRMVAWVRDKEGEVIRMPAHIREEISRRKRGLPPKEMRYVEGAMGIAFDYETLLDAVPRDIDFQRWAEIQDEYENVVKHIEKYLTEREADIIIRRGRGYTLEEIAKGYSVTRERIRQIQARAHNKLCYRWPQYGEAMVENARRREERVGA